MIFRLLVLTISLLLITSCGGGTTNTETGKEEVLPSLALDSDGDGVVDSEDKYPSDPDASTDYTITFVNGLSHCTSPDINTESLKVELDGSIIAFLPSGEKFSKQLANKTYELRWIFESGEYSKDEPINLIVKSNHTQIWWCDPGVELNPNNYIETDIGNYTDTDGDGIFDNFDQENTIPDDKLTPTEVSFDISTNGDSVPTVVELMISGESLFDFLSDYEKICFYGYLEEFSDKGLTDEVKIPYHVSDIRLHPEFGSPVEYENSTIEQCFTIREDIAFENLDTKLVNKSTSQLKLETKYSFHGNYKLGVVAYKNGYPSYPFKENTIILNGYSLNISDIEHIDFYLPESTSDHISYNLDRYYLDGKFKVLHEEGTKTTLNTYITTEFEHIKIFKGSELLFENAARNTDYVSYFYYPLATAVTEERVYVLKEREASETSYEIYEVSYIDGTSKIHEFDESCLYSYCIEEAVQAKANGNNIEYYFNNYNSYINLSLENYELTSHLKRDEPVIEIEYCDGEKVLKDNGSNLCVNFSEVEHEFDSCLIASDKMYCLKWQDLSHNFTYKKEDVNGSLHSLTGTESLYTVELWISEKMSSITTSDFKLIDSEEILPIYYRGNNDTSHSFYKGISLEEVIAQEEGFELVLNYLTNIKRSECIMGGTTFKQCLTATHGIDKQQIVRLDIVNTKVQSPPMLTIEEDSQYIEFTAGDEITYSLTGVMMNIDNNTARFPFKVYDQEGIEVEKFTYLVENSDGSFSLSIKADSAFEGTLVYEDERFKTEKNDIYIKDYRKLPLLYANGVREAVIYGNWERNSSLGHRAALINFNGNENSGTGYIMKWSDSTPVVEGIYMEYNWQKVDDSITYEFTYGVGCNFYEGKWTTENISLPDPNGVTDFVDRITPTKLLLNRNGIDYTYTFTNDTVNRPVDGDTCTKL